MTKTEKTIKKEICQILADNNFNLDDCLDSLEDISDYIASEEILEPDESQYETEDEMEAALKPIIIEREKRAAEIENVMMGKITAACEKYEAELEAFNKKFLKSL
jgi:hypothetical protein